MRTTYAIYSTFCNNKNSLKEPSNSINGFFFFEEILYHVSCTWQFALRGEKKGRKKKEEKVHKFPPYVQPNN